MGRFVCDRTPMCGGVERFGCLGECQARSTFDVVEGLGTCNFPLAQHDFDCATRDLASNLRVILWSVGIDGWCADFGESEVLQEISVLKKIANVVNGLLRCFSG